MDSCNIDNENEIRNDKENDHEEKVTWQEVASLWDTLSLAFFVEWLVIRFSSFVILQMVLTNLHYCIRDIGKILSAE